MSSIEPPRKPCRRLKTKQTSPPGIQIGSLKNAHQDQQDESTEEDPDASTQALQDPRRSQDVQGGAQAHDRTTSRNQCTPPNLKACKLSWVQNSRNSLRTTKRKKQVRIWTRKKKREGYRRHASGSMIQRSTLKAERCPEDFAAVLTRCLENAERTEEEKPDKDTEEDPSL